MGCGCSCNCIVQAGTPNVTVTGNGSGSTPFTVSVAEPTLHPIATFGWVSDSSIDVVSDEGDGPVYVDLGGSVYANGFSTDTDPWDNSMDPAGVFSWFAADDGSAFIEILQPGMLYVQMAVNFDLDSFDDSGNLLGLRAACGELNVEGDDHSYNYLLRALTADAPSGYFTLGFGPVDHRPGGLPVQINGWLPWTPTRSFRLFAVNFSDTQTHLNVDTVELLLTLYQGAS